MSFILPGSPDYLQEAQKWLGQSFDKLNQSRAQAEIQIRKLAELLAKNRCIPDDGSLVVYGSLARREWTPSSDLDWSLLIDGPVDPTHIQVAHTIKSIVSEMGIKDPGRDGVFGKLSFSHDLVHRIGGQNDSNQNLTQRILLLLESCAVGDEQAYERVVRAILERYCEEDSHLYSEERKQFKVPRFLLNDGG
jgi:predicted nucleotidyltransferase